ncbi:hypothetical protein AOQ84DRAFT_230022 [Glonium stellatum]|uniref:Uncharacterized protein n=1 Tax=Glonium stellatum TaxID=574774 RepID=A0A8E2F5Y4_9PEZI|nr:hypothetical protein AOQ84DRAFT_230022 [Glonium stellatum]
MSTNAPQPPALLPSVFPQDPPSPSSPPHPPVDNPQNSHDAAPPPDLVDEAAYIEPDAASLLPPPNFTPFFTLIEDADTGEHYHPYVHYVFSDDDPVLLTAASMRALGVDDAALIARPPEPEPLNDSTNNNTNTNINNDDDSNPNTESRLSRGARDDERFLLLDVGADGASIVAAQSLSAEWQVTGTQVRAAPTWDEEAVAQGGGISGGVMVRVEGVEVPQPHQGQGQGKQKTQAAGEQLLQEARAAAGGDLFAGMEAVVGKFEKDAEVLRRIVGEREEVGIVGGG